MIYKRKVVAFYDILGWQSKIAEAGNDSEKIEKLLDAVSLYARVVRASAEDVGWMDFRLSSFSDNVVLSFDLEPKKTAEYLIFTLGSVQLSMALGGFFLRGGITIGEILHTGSVVLGPALNRAYDLERKTAVHPRIVLDEEAAQYFSNMHKVVVTENGVAFIDPFSLEFVFIRQLNDLQRKDKEPDPLLQSVSPFQTILAVTSVVGEALCDTKLEERGREKLRWLNARMKARLDRGTKGWKKRRFDLPDRQKELPD